MISKSLLWRMLVLGIFSALPVGIAASDHIYSDHVVEEKYFFTVPAGYWVTVRVAFGTHVAESLMLRHQDGDLRIGAWNNFNIDERTWGPWRATNTTKHTELYFTDYHEEGNPVTWRRSEARILKPATLLPDKKTTYTVIQWSDTSAKNAVTLEMRMSPDKDAAADLFKAPPPAAANAPK